MRYLVYQPVLAILAGLFLAHTCLAAGCSPGSFVDVHECMKAFSEIVYSKQPMDTLDRVSTEFSRLFGNCALIVKNPLKRLVTKNQIESGFKDIFNLCQTQPGFTNPISTAQEVFLEVQDHRTGRDSKFFPPKTLAVGLNSNCPLTQKTDCEQAYKSIPADSHGRLLADQHNATQSITKSFKTCTVLLYTTDGSPLKVTKHDIDPTVAQMIKDCHGKSGVVGLDKGASGNNGLAVIKIRSSKTCRGPADLDGQVCK